MQVLRVRVAKESVFDQLKFGRVDQGEAAFLLRKAKCRCNRLAPAKRPVAGIDGVIPQPEESLPRAPVPAVPLPGAPGRLCPRLNAFVTADSRQNSCAELVARISRSRSCEGLGVQFPGPTRRDVSEAMVALNAHEAGNGG